MNQKKIPFSSEAEQTIIGSMLSSFNAVNACIDTLNSDDFHIKEHKVIFDAIKMVSKRGDAVDTVTVTEALIQSGSLASSGGVDFLMNVSNFAEPYGNLEAYIKIIKNKSMFRKIIFASNEAQKLGFSDNNSPIETLDQIQKMFFEISLEDFTPNFKLAKDIISGEKSIHKKSFSDLITDYQEKIAAGIDPNQLAGVPSGFIDLDKKIGGFGNSNLIVLAARPGMGKTTLALNFLLNTAKLHKIPVAMFSLEMGSDQLVWKLCGCEAEINAENAKKNIITPMEFQNLVGSAGVLSQLPIFLEDPPKITIAQLKSRSRRLKQVHNIGMLIIDYLQLISTTEKSQNRQEEVASISRELKSLARELNIPVICLAQLSRKVEERESKQPVMSDLRESGAIEQDSDVIIFINRRDYHNPIDKPGEAEIIVAKNRHGETGTVKLCFEKNIGKFKNYAPLERMPDFHDETEKNFDSKFKEFS